jgi:hypothetical protein
MWIGLYSKTTPTHESQNRANQINTNKPLNVVCQYYTTDKNRIYKTLTAGNGFGVDPAAEKRKATNIQRQNFKRNNRPKRSHGPKVAFEKIEKKNNLVS